MASKKKKISASKSKKPKFPEAILNFPFSRTEYLSLVPDDYDISLNNVKNVNELYAILDILRSRTNHFLTVYANNDNIYNVLQICKYLIIEAKLLCDYFSDLKSNISLKNNVIKYFEAPVLCWLFASDLFIKSASVPLLSSDGVFGKYLLNIFFELNHDLLNFIFSNSDCKIISRQYAFSEPNSIKESIFLCIKPGIEIYSYILIPPIFKEIDENDIYAICPKCSESYQNKKLNLNCPHCSRRYTIDEWEHISSDRINLDIVIFKKDPTLTPLMDSSISVVAYSNVLLSSLNYFSRRITNNNKHYLLKSIASSLINYSNYSDNEYLKVALEMLYEKLGEKYYWNKDIIALTVSLCNYYAYLLLIDKSSSCIDVTQYYSIFKKCIDPPLSNPDKIINNLQLISNEKFINDKLFLAYEDDYIKNVSFEYIHSIVYFWIEHWLLTLRPIKYIEFIKKHKEKEIEALLFSDWRKIIINSKDNNSQNGQNINKYHALIYLLIFLSKIARRMLLEVFSIRPIVPSMGASAPAGSYMREEPSFNEELDGLISNVLKVGFYGPDWFKRNPEVVVNRFIT